MVNKSQKINTTCVARFGVARCLRPGKPPWSPWSGTFRLHGQKLGSARPGYETSGEFMVNHRKFYGF